MKILIGVPTGGTIEPEVFKAIYDLDPAGHELHFDFVRGYDTAESRNRIVRQALDGWYDYILFVDSDTIIPADTLELMFEEPVADICLGVCPRKNTKEGKSAIIRFGTQGCADGSYYYRDLPEGKVEVKGGGFACALVKTDLLRTMSEPWFNYALYEDGSILSEDFYFCDKAKWEHALIMADFRVRCGHLARYFQYE